MATLATSTHRHLEVFYAVAGIGAVCHTVNPRLHPDQVVWILNHAESTIMLADPAFVDQAQAALAARRRSRPKHPAVMQAAAIAASDPRLYAGRRR